VLGRRWRPLAYLLFQQLDDSEPPGAIDSYEQDEVAFGRSSLDQVGEKEPGWISVDLLPARPTSSHLRQTDDSRRAATAFARNHVTAMVTDSNDSMIELEMANRDPLLGITNACEHN
jgi:hypothetical protein